MVSQVLELGVGPGRGLRWGWGTLPLGPQSRELEKGVGGLSCEMTCHPNCHGQRTTGMPGHHPLLVPGGWGLGASKPAASAAGTFSRLFICPPYMWTQGWPGVVLGWRAAIRGSLAMGRCQETPTGHFPSLCCPLPARSPVTALGPGRRQPPHTPSVRKPVGGKCGD